MNRIKEFLKSSIGHLALFALVIAGAFITGRYSAPVQVMETQKVVIQEHETIKVVEVEKTIIEKAKDITEGKSIHKERTEEVRPDGTKLTKETVDINIDRTIRETEIKFVDRTLTVEKEVEKLVEVVKEKIIVTKKPDWAVTARLGLALSELKLSTALANPLVVGVEVDRRVLGPVRIGLWADSNTTFSDVRGGLAVGMEF